MPTRGGPATSCYLATIMNNHHCLYVSPNGDDKFTGRLPSTDGNDGPFLTLEAARDAIRVLGRAGFDRPITVMLLNGTHRRREPLQLDHRDSGTDRCPVTWAAFPGHHPVISGGQVLTAWEPHAGGIQRCHVPEAKSDRLLFRHLFYNGVRQVRSRWPKRNPDDPLYGGWGYITKTFPDDATNPDGLIYDETEAIAHPPLAWSKPHHAELNIFIWMCWINHLLPIRKVDHAARTIQIDASRVLYDMTLTRGNRFIVENALETLTEPGEWCLDPDDGMVYFYPPETHAGETVVPITDRLLEIIGTEADPVHDVIVRGLTFTHTRNPFPEQLNEDCFHAPCIRGEAVRLEQTSDCRVEYCTFESLGGDGVRLHGNNHDNHVHHNEVSTCGGAGISLSSDSTYNDNDWTNRQKMRLAARAYARSSGNIIAHNHIHDCGNLKKNGAAVQVFGHASTDNVIAHNHIHDMPDKGIVLQDGYGRFTLEYNHIHDVAQEICDTGAIMTNRWYPLPEEEGLGDGHVVRFNLIRNVVGCGAYGDPVLVGPRLHAHANGRLWAPYMNWGIYFDNSGMKGLVFGNVVIGAYRGGVSLPVGDPQDNHYENNIFVNCLVHQADFHVGGERPSGNRFVRNILAHDDPDATMVGVSANTIAGFAAFDFNLYGTPGGRPPRRVHVNDEMAEEEVARQWDAANFDAHSLVADPLFVDPEAGDFRLKTESPAYALGFQPLDLSRVGPEGTVGNTP